MLIGIVGIGVIGTALKFGFEKLGNSVLCHDKKYETKLSDLIQCDSIYICVPTPSKKDGSCDISIVENVVDELNTLKYSNTIIIKSTVEPGTTELLIKKYNNSKICFVPEFLRERCSISDFVENHDLLAIGTNNIENIDVIKNNHGYYPKNIIIMKPTEAELLKYYSNIYNALRIVFANEMFELANFLGADYNSIKNAYIARNTHNMYLDVNEHFRGYGGVCLPKDTKAIVALCKKNNLDLKLFETIDNENSKFKKTVFKNMREI